MLLQYYGSMETLENFWKTAIDILIIKDEDNLHILIQNELIYN